MIPLSESDLSIIPGESPLVPGEPQPQLHILSERRPDDPPALKTHYLQDHDQAQLLFLQQEELERMGEGSLVEAAENKMGGSEFDEDDQASSSMMPFSELLSDPEKDEGQDPPSSTTGDSGEKPTKRANQGKIVTESDSKSLTVCLPEMYLRRET